MRSLQTASFKMELVNEIGRRAGSSTQDLCSTTRHLGTAGIYIIFYLKLQDT